MNCKICTIQENRLLFSGMMIYEDDICAAILSKKPASLCHVILFPKKHLTILEQVSDSDFGHMLNVSNKISRGMFESLNIQGTNIFIQNGIDAGQEEPHFIINIIARVEKDDVRLNWEPRKLSEEEMSTIELKYKEFTEGSVFKEEKKQHEISAPEEKEEKTVIKKPQNNDDEEEQEENYQLRYFNKSP
jgi:histidine triad (HIT) family protein